MPLSNNTNIIRDFGHTQIPGQKSLKITLHGIFHSSAPRRAILKIMGPTFFQFTMSFLKIILVLGLDEDEVHN